MSLPYRATSTRPRWIHPTVQIAALLAPAALALSAQAFGRPAPPAGGTGPLVFNRDIRPILSDNCFACHGPDKNKRQADLRLDQPNRAVVAGSAKESRLVQRINRPDGDPLQMPPASFHKRLTLAQKQLFATWIAQGAKYQKHWSYEPPAKAAVPASVNPVDFLIRKRLADVGLKPAAPADRRTLLRRLSFDLLGLPPTPGEADAFVADKAPDAYAKLVDRLLASPHFGERMAQSWLDTVRFADTIGYHSDNPRNIWPYRDWVINAFNLNKPFDRFTREQIAGDLLPDANQETRIGSAFNRLLLTTEEGGAQAKDYEARYLTDRVRAIGTVWLGQTTGCAQCHDHKFDPITTRDFYSLGAYFADIDEAIVGGREPGMVVTTPEQAAELGRRTARITELEQQINGPHPELAAAQAAWERHVWSGSRWTPLKPEKLTTTGGTVLTALPDNSVLASGPNSSRELIDVQAAYVGKIAGLRIEALPHDSLPQRGPGRAGNGNFVITEVQARIIGPGGESRPVEFGSAAADIEQASYAEANPYRKWAAASTIDGDSKGAEFGWAILPESGRPHVLILSLARPQTLGTGEKLRIELKQNHSLDHNLGRFRLSATGSEDALAIQSPVPDEIASLVKIAPAERAADQAEKVRAYFRTIAPELASFRAQLAEARKARSDFEASLPRCLVTNRNARPRTVRILPRGNFLDETGPLVQPATPAFLPNPTGGTRLDLANWIVSTDNPLTARAVMNRLWKQLFGGGLSKVVEDLGAQGEPPNNLALLDWLACEFRDSGWDFKHMFRLLVTSATYKQTSVPTKEQLQLDPLNREFARQGRFRLEAEEVRDNALAVSGLLVDKIGGPSVKPYQPERYWENLNFPVRDYVADRGENQYRRGLYTWWQRSFLHPSLLAFDAPTREECCADRTRSNIPQQALVLLNDPTYVEAARALAARILQTPGTPDQRIAWAMRTAIQRAPRPDEAATLRGLLDRQLAAYRADLPAADAFLKSGFSPVPDNLDHAELAAWTHVARVLLNLHESITRS